MKVEFVHICNRFAFHCVLFYDFAIVRANNGRNIQVYEHMHTLRTYGPSSVGVEKLEISRCEHIKEWILNEFKSTAAMRRWTVYNSPRFHKHTIA